MSSQFLLQIAFVVVILLVGGLILVQLRTIHKLVNSRLSEALARIDQLEELLNSSVAKNEVLKSGGKE